MSKSIKIDDATYEAVAKFAQQEDRLLSNALARLVKLGLANASEEIQVKEQTDTPRQVETITLDVVKRVTQPKIEQAAPTGPLANVNWQKIMEEVTSPEGRRNFEGQLRAAEEREASRKQTIGDLTEEDLATAKVTFEDRPDFKEPEKWDPHNWPTV